MPFRNLDFGCMMKRYSILQLWNPLLRELSQKVDPSSLEVQELVEILLDAVDKEKGIGIAAPQIGQLKQVFILNSRPINGYDDAPLMEPRAIINPEILEYSEEIVDGYEGCLSILTFKWIVPRHSRIVVKYQDLNWNWIQEKIEGFVARIFQHEFDHLNGLFFTDRVKDMKSLIMLEELERQRDV